MMNRCWKRLAVALAVGTIIAVGLVGCNETKVPEAEVVVSEVVSEAVSEEVPEAVTSEAESEEENGGVEYINCSGMSEFEEYLKGLDKTAIVEYNFGIEDSFQAIISNGSNYKMQLGNIIGVRSNKEIIEIVANTDGFDIHPPMKANIWMIMINTTGTDIEVSCTIKYADGTEEDVTVYVTVGEAADANQEEPPGVETVQFSHIDELIAYTTERNQTAIVEFDFSATELPQSIIPNGAKHTMQIGERLRVIATKEVESIDANVDGLAIYEESAENVWVVGVLNSGTDMEVSFTVNYKDGTSEDFTIYVTKE